MSKRPKFKPSLVFDRVVPKLPARLRLPLLRLRRVLPNGYLQWLRKNQTPPPKHEGQVAFSVLTLVFDPAPDHLRRCVESILGSRYENFELILVDNGCKKPEVLNFLKGLENEKRARVLRPKAALGISLGTKLAVTEAKGEWLVFVDHDDLLDPWALAKLAMHISPELHMLYTNHDHCDELGNRFGPVFKPGPSKDLILSYNYVTHLHAVRKSFFESKIDPRPELDGSQDWDVTLQALETPEKVRHVPEVLYTHRQHPGQFSATHHRSRAKASTQVAKSQRLVLDSYLRRNGLEKKFRIEETSQIGCYRLVPGTT